MAVVVTAMLELAEYAAAMMVRHVIVVVGVEHIWMGMLVLDVTFDALDGLLHDRTSLGGRCSFPGTSSGRRGCHGIGARGAAFQWPNLARRLRSGRPYRL